MGKRILIFCLSLCMVMGLAACGGNGGSSPTGSSASPAASPASPATSPAAEPSSADTPKKEVSITFGMWDEVQKPTFEKVIDRFMELNPHIKVEIVLTPWDQYWVKLDAAAGAKNAPDVYWMNIYMPKYADAGVIEPLDSWLDGSGVNRSQWSEGSMRMYNYKGSQYTLPRNSDSVVVAYNRAIFDKYGVEHPKEGWTWEDMRSLGIELRDKIAAAGGDEYPMVMELDGQPSWTQFMAQEGVDTYPADGLSNGFATPGGIKAFDDIVKLMDDNIMPNYNILSDTKGTDLFISGKAAMVYVGSWKAVVLDEASIASDIGLIMMPKKENNKCAVGGISYAMSADSANKEAAWELTLFLASEESSRMQAEAKLIMPAYLAAQEYFAPQFQNIPGKVYADAAANSAPYPTHPAFTEWIPDQNEITGQIFSKQVSAEEGCKKLSDLINEKMAEFAANQ